MKLLLTGLLLLAQLHLSAQTLKADDVKNLSVSWEILDNDWTTGKEARSIIVFTNKGSQAFPAQGWALYFNSANFKVTDPATGNVSLVNGDLQAFKPGPKFGSLKPGESRKVEVSHEALRNISEFPQGFFLAFDNDPGKGYPVQVNMKPFSSLKNDLVVANRIYKQNAGIETIAPEKLIKVFPTPTTYKLKGEKFLLDSTALIVADVLFKSEADQLRTFFAQLTGTNSTATSGSGKQITLRKTDGLGPEEYKLSVTAGGISIQASTPAGAFYAIQSLKTLVTPSASKSSRTIAIDGVEISDAPRFPHRAFSMDVARNFQPKSEVLKVLDLMALYKLNVFHFHFSEDEAWRLEIPALPELTAIGSKRAPTKDSHTNLPPSYGSGADTTNSGTGFYSKNDFIEILRYATARHIKVIPEIESPGHARAAIKAMDARFSRLQKAGKEAEARKYLLRDPNDQSVYRSVQGWNDNVINVAMPSAYTFMETVIDEIRKMYNEANAPLERIHMGGDEVPQGVWEKSPAVSALMKKDPAVKSANDLWYYYFNRVNTILQKRNLSLYGWEEAGLVKQLKNGTLAWTPNTDFAKKNVMVDVWNNLPGSGAEDLAYRLANAGIKVVLTNVTNFYFDLASNQSFNEPGLYWGGYLDLDKPFYFKPYNYLQNLKDDNGNPIDQSKIKGRVALTEFGKSNIIGLQGAIWSETIRTPERFEYMILPKFLGLAERAWASDPDWAMETNAAKSEELYQKAWSQFITVVGKRELPRLDEYAGGFNYRVPAPGAVIENGQVKANIQFPGFTIRYTTDGTEPSPSSPVYTSPIAAKGTVKLKGFNLSGRSSQTLTVENR